MNICLVNLESDNGCQVILHVSLCLWYKVGKDYLTLNGGTP
jgi:hypothetical protein